jgi:hypothetical protein
MIRDVSPVLDTIPPPTVVRDQLGRALREVSLLRRILRLAEKAEQYRSLRPLGSNQPREVCGGH